MLVARVAIATTLLVACSFEGGGGASPDANIIESQDASVDASVDSSSDGSVLPACHSSFDDLTIGANKYRVLTDVSSYADAVTRCDVDGGRLVIIEPGNQTEIDALSAYLIANNVSGGTECLFSGGTAQCAWIGLNQGPANAPGEAWTWLDGNAAVDFWGFTEPNDQNGSENGQEDCGELRADLSFPNINDIDCDQNLPAICECHSI